MNAMQVFERELSLPVSPEEAYAWHGRPGAFSRLAPPWQTLRIVGEVPEIAEGTRLAFRIYQGPTYLTWLAEHRDVRPGRSFRDVQLRGPFAHWDHLHELRPAPGGCVLRDYIRYALPMGPLGRWIGGPKMGSDLDRLFRYRHSLTASDIADHQHYAGQPKLRIALLEGGSSLAEGLFSYLSTGGHHLLRLPSSPRDFPAGSLEGVDAVVYFGAGPQSWADGAREVSALVESLAALDRKPQCLMVLGGIGIYGTGRVGVDEDSPLPEAAPLELVALEEAGSRAEALGIRSIRLRMGSVLHLAGPQGKGHEPLPWISRDDALGAIQHILMRRELSGPINLVAPGRGTAASIRRDLIELEGRLPRVLQATFRRGMPKMDCPPVEVHPAKLEDSGYAFRHPESVDGLRHLLGKSSF